MSLVICSNCRRPYPDEGVPTRCPVCGGYYDLPVLPDYDRQALERSAGQPGIWRFGPLLGVEPSGEPVSLGEGGAPLVWGKAFGRQVAFKLESHNPSGSFKDRGSAVLVQFLINRGVQAALEDSSGNAGASLAAYCARAGIKIQVYMPDSAASLKRRLVESFGAEVVQVRGAPSNAADAVGQAIDENAAPGLVYASHAYLAHNLAGYATLAYELIEQLGQAPGTVVLPVGQGGLLLGIGRGFEALQRAAVISTLPMLVGVQVRACAPLWAVQQFGIAGMSWTTEGQTAAESVRVIHPLRGDAVLGWLNAHAGLLLAVEEDQILLGQQALAAQGFSVEPASALVWDGLRQVIEQAREPVVAVLTGSGARPESGLTSSG